MKRFVVFMLAMGMPMAAQVSRPVLGLMADAVGGLRPVYGVPASTTLGDSLVSGVISSGCSAILCLAKTSGALWSSAMLADGASDATSVLVTSAPAGPALFAFSGSGAYVYFSNTQTLAWWQAGTLSQVAFTADGEILALNAAGDGLDYAVRRSGATWVEHVAIATAGAPAAAGQALMKTSLGETGPVILVDDGVITTAGGASAGSSQRQNARVGKPVGNKSAVLTRTDGTQVQFAIPGITSFARMGGGYVHAVTGEGMWAIQVVAGSERAFLLPGIPVVPTMESPGGRLGPKTCCEVAR